MDGQTFPNAVQFFNHPYDNRYSFGQFFHMKYVVFYGMARVFMLSDGIDAPNSPKCIGRIHLYSDMWRYFDEGLYRFIHK